MDANSNKFISCIAHSDKLSILKTTRKLLTIACLSVFFIHTISAQEVKKKTIHFLADTVDIPKNSRLLEIGLFEREITYYVFFARVNPSITLLLCLPLGKIESNWRKVHHYLSVITFLRNYSLNYFPSTAMISLITMS